MCAHVHWYDDLMMVAAFAEWAVNCGFSGADLRRALEEPWKWTTEFELHVQPVMREGA